MTAISDAIIKTNKHQSCAKQTKHMGGLYGGVMAGYLSGSSRVKREMLVGPKNGDKSDVAGDGITGGVFLGYKKVFPCQMFIAPEIFFTRNGLSGNMRSRTDLLTNDVEVKIKSKYSYGAVVNIGRICGMAAPFLRAGLVFGKWSSHFKSSLIGKGSRSKTRPGIEIGAGSDFKVTKNVCLGFFFAHRHFSRFRYNVVSAGDSAEVIRTKVRPGSNVFMLRLIFKSAK